MNYFAGVFIMGIGIGFFLFSNSMFSGESHPPPVAFRIAFAVVPLFFVLAGITLLFKTSRLSSAPLQRRIAAVVDERMNVTSNDKRSTTAYFCTLQFENGKRVEMKTKAKVAGLVTRGDIGIVYTKLDHIIDFRRVAV